MMIHVICKGAYGREFFYPVNDLAEILCKILGRKTLTKKQLLIAKDAGWEVIIKTEDFKLE